MKQTKVKYLSPRQIAADIVANVVFDTMLRTKLRAAIIQAIIERDHFWKQEMARIVAK